GATEAVAESVRREWEQMKERLGIDGKAEQPPGFPGDFQDLESWIERQEKDFEKQLKNWDDTEASRPVLQGPTLGILVGPASPALLAQLNLERGAALIIHEVQVGSLAEK